MTIEARVARTLAARTERPALYQSESTPHTSCATR